jgi:hypothetical protein
MIDMTWTATPAPFAGALAACPAGAVSLRAAAPAAGLRTAVASARRRTPVTGLPFGATTDELHVLEQSTKNDPSLGIHSPGRPLS